MNRRAFLATPLAAAAAPAPRACDVFVYGSTPGGVTAAVEAAARASALSSPARK